MFSPYQAILVFVHPARRVLTARERVFHLTCFASAMCHCWLVRHCSGPRANDRSVNHRLLHCHVFSPRHLVADGTRHGAIRVLSQTKSHMPSSVGLRACRRSELRLFSSVLPPQVYTHSN